MLQADLSDIVIKGLTGGKLGEADPTSVINTEPRRIEPGTILSNWRKLDGAGIVSSGSKLRAPTKPVLANSDLWLEITVDGESVPAIAAPARYLFPVFASGDSKDLDTLIMAGKEGVASLLAMPYGADIAIAVRNRGDKPIENVAVSMSVDPANDKNRKDYAGRMRLRGIFQPAGSLSAVLARQMGRGAGYRWCIASPTTRRRESPRWRSTARSVPAGRWRISIRFGASRANPAISTVALSAYRGNLGWRYMLLEPVNFEQSLWASTRRQTGRPSVLFYVKN